MSKRIRLVFGCGYVGLPVARTWSGDGDKVYAITRNKERFSKLTEEGLVPVLGDITLPESLSKLSGDLTGKTIDTVLLAVGFDRGRYENIHDVYVTGLKNVLDNLPDSVGQLIYISSTGVYGQTDGEAVDEDSPTLPTRPGGRACLAAEQLLRASRFAQRVTILRFAGIYGPGRVPGKRFIETGDWSKLSKTGMLNLIHRDDGVRVIHNAASEDQLEHSRGQTFLVSDGSPVLRREFYDEVASALRAGPISWDDVGDADGIRRSGGLGKRLSNQKLVSRFQFEFEYSDYRVGLQQALAGQG